MMDFLIKMDPNSPVPKYRQVINSVIHAIDTNQLSIGDKIPSVGEVSEHTGLAQKTVVQAFEHLKRTGVISSVKYKGFFVASSDTQSRHNIFVLFNIFTAYKEEIYNSLKDSLGDKGTVDIYFHHNNIEVFNTLVEKSAGRYTEYIIMPIADPAVEVSMRKLPSDKLYILDMGYQEWGQKYPSVCQYFEEDIFDALSSYIEKVRKYDKIVMVSGERYYNSAYSDRGFQKFCETYGLANAITLHSKGKKPEKGVLYIIFDDYDLVDMVRQARLYGMQAGRDFGIISYNETPFKDVIGEGIATISTDFQKMGRSMAKMIVRRGNDHIRNPCRLIDRNSF
ncbi:GntR family transcriptional regulator [Dyadobacter aurulentus]|uniref:GntR family transcriptional regulator n=1 Tax=Dyadobacter sp. UC 10 TaxID=2605428 RepID=UPI0011F296A7|nr:GntR family transcriptional regulator [Dyadobacter sp. UC 10]KAA0989138.1 GntR family transcriptional regulator [Dyadobacter sp. UC 10]